jgi:hypothetical protein
MRRRRSITCLAATCLLAFAAIRAQAAGYFNMPGTHAQRAGHGFGAGYHAPLLLGPVRLDGLGFGNQVRLPYSPVPHCGCNSWGECGRIIEAPTAMPGTVPTTTRPEAPLQSGAASSEPTPAVESPAEPVRPIFAAPVQR